MDPSNQHALQSSWTIWFDKKPKNKAKLSTNYEENLVKVGTFQTVEQFYRYYVHLKKASELPKESNVHIFREGSKPMWESFPKGGCFIKKVRKTEDNLLQRMWEELIIATIGEAFEDPDVVGIVLSIRPKEDAISIWNKDNHNHSLRVKIGEILKEIWNLEAHTSIEYKQHSTSMRDGSTYRMKTASHLTLEMLTPSNTKATDSPPDQVQQSA
mmetsp:Transcript_29047/g.40881  ORF Transcript_29047/g.40881 Transcript_29047/m.40881 type:complete len:213 (-) Transcript_29047:1253-1891(-)